MGRRDNSRLYWFCIINSWIRANIKIHFFINSPLCYRICILVMTCPDNGNGPLPGSCIAKAAYQGNCKGVLRSLPSTASAVPISLFEVNYCVGSLGSFKPYLGPRGAQYSPVCDMLKVLIHSMRDSAASSGVTATLKYQCTSSWRRWNLLTSAIIPILIESYTPRHLRPLTHIISQANLLTQPHSP